jgi:hypothetical protein
MIQRTQGIEYRVIFDANSPTLRIEFPDAVGIEKKINRRRTH